MSDNSLTIPNRRLGNGAMNVRLMLLLVVWFFILFYKSIDLVRIVCISDDMTATKQNKCQNIFIPFGSLLSLCIIVLRLSSPTKTNDQNERKRRKKKQHKQPNLISKTRLAKQFETSSPLILSLPTSLPLSFIQFVRISPHYSRGCKVISVAAWYTGLKYLDLDF